MINKRKSIGLNAASRQTSTTAILTNLLPNNAAYFRKASLSLLLLCLTQLGIAQENNNTVNNNTSQSSNATIAPLWDAADSLEVDLIVGGVLSFAVVATVLMTIRCCVLNHLRQQRERAAQQQVQIQIQLQPRQPQQQNMPEPQQPNETKPGTFPLERIQVQKEVDKEDSMELKP